MADLVSMQNKPLESYLLWSFLCALAWRKFVVVVAVVAAVVVSAASIVMFIARPQYVSRISACEIGPRRIMPLTGLRHVLLHSPNPSVEMTLACS